MKSTRLILAGLVTTSSVSAYAESKVSLSPSARSYEMVVEGNIAEKLFNTIDANPRRVDSPEGTWLNKSARGIVCGQNLKSRRFACSFNIDETGVL